MLLLYTPRRAGTSTALAAHELPKNPKDSTVAFLHVNLTGSETLLPIMVCLHYSPADPLSDMTQFSRILTVLDTVDALFMDTALPSSLLRDIRSLTYHI